MILGNSVGQKKREFGPKVTGKITGITGNEKWKGEGESRR
jgi:hypothetical protein